MVILAPVRLDEQSTHGEHYAAALAKELDANLTCSMVRGRAPGKDIARVASEYDADLIVMATHARKGARRLLFGSVAEDVLRRAVCPVLLVPDQAVKRHREPNLNMILFATDFELGSMSALEHVKLLAKRTDAQVVVMHARRPAALSSYEGPYVHGRPVPTLDWKDPNEHARNHVQRIADGLKESGIQATWALERGDPTQMILASANEVRADLIVVGTHSRRGFARWVLGSVAEAVVRNAPCPVLTVPLAGQTHGWAVRERLPRAARVTAA